MEGDLVSQRARAFLLAGVLALLVAGGAAPAQARPVPPSPTVALGSVARLAPDGRSVDIDLAASCPQRWTVVEAVVSVSQGQASGQAPFPLTCTGGPKAFTVTVQSGGAPFQLGQAQATATVRIQRGRTLQAQDSQVVRVVPSAVVRLADTALLADGGAALFVDVTVGCPVGASGQQSFVTVTQSPTSGQGTFVPTCDGQQHTFTVRVQATQGLFQAGSAQGSAFVVIAEGGDLFFGEDNRPVQIS
jgi:hypothetical protein